MLRDYLSQDRGGAGARSWASSASLASASRDSSTSSGRASSRAAWGASRDAASPTAARIPYLPIIDIVRGSFGVLDTDAADVVAGQGGDRTAGAGDGPRRLGALSPPPARQQGGRGGGDRPRPRRAGGQGPHDGRATPDGNRGKPPAPAHPGRRRRPVESTRPPRRRWPRSRRASPVPGHADHHVPAGLPAAVAGTVLCQPGGARSADAGGQPRRGPFRHPRAAASARAGPDDRRPRRGRAVLPGGVGARRGRAPGSEI